MHQLIAQSPRAQAKFFLLMDDIVDDGNEDEIDPEKNPDESSTFQFQIIEENKECLKLLDEFDPALCIE